MPLYGVTFENFQGLDLSDAANETGGSIDMLNADMDVRGRVRARDGFTKFSAATLSGGALTLVALPASTGQILATSGIGSVRSLNASTGATIATFTGGAVPSPRTMVPFASPTGTGVAYGSTTGAANLLKYDGAAFTSLAAGGLAPFYVGTTSVDNRLMLIRVTGIANTDFRSTVQFSDAYPGSPETFGANNFIQLSPGDGEEIRGNCNFANQTYIFKQTKFFVLTGTSTDSAGNPVFNYRTVNAGKGIPIGVFNGACCPGPDGVYFYSGDGIYRTTGGAPVKVSGAIDPLFGIGGPVPPYFQGFQVGPSSNAVPVNLYLQVFNSRLYVTYDGVTGGRQMLVYDIATQTWLSWGVAATGMCVNPVTGLLTFGYAGVAAPTGTNDIGQFVVGATTDAGTAIPWRYRSGFVSFDYAGRTIKRGIQGVEKTIREAIVDGSGQVDFGLAKQWTQKIATNLVTNPGLEIATTGWANTGNALNPGSTITRVTTQQHSGTASLQVVTTAALANEGTEYALSGLTFTSGVAYTVTFWAKGNAGGENIQFVFGDVGAGDTLTTAATVLTTSWQQITGTWTPSGNRTAVVLDIRNTSAVVMTFFLDDVMVVQSNIPFVAMLALGTSPQVAQARDRRAVRARMFSYQFSGVAPATVEKLVLNLREFKEVGVQESGN